MLPNMMKTLVLMMHLSVVSAQNNFCDLCGDRGDYCYAGRKCCEAVPADGGDPNSISSGYACNDGTVSSTSCDQANICPGPECSDCQAPLNNLQVGLGTVCEAGQKCCDTGLGTGIACEAGGNVDGGCEFADLCPGPPLPDCSDCGGQGPCEAGQKCCDLGFGFGPQCKPPSAVVGGCATAIICASGVQGDPHMSGAHGDKWDFKGKDNIIYTLLSWTYVTVNALFKHKRYTDAGPKHRVVEGSYMTEGYVTVRTALGRLLHIEYDAARAVAIKIGVNNSLTAYKAPFSMTLDDVSIALADRVVTIKTAQWAIGLLSKLKPGMVGAGTTCADGKCYLETSISPRVNVTTLTVAPHGLIGQTYDSDDLGVIGKLDEYKPDKDGVITTSAMGEGAIEGVAADYEVSSKFATDFKFSRWGKAEAKPRDVSKLTGQKVKVGTKGAKDTATATELE